MYFIVTVLLMLSVILSFILYRLLVEIWIPACMESRIASEFFSFKLF